MLKRVKDFKKENKWLLGTFLKQNDKKIITVTSINTTNAKY